MKKNTKIKDFLIEIKIRLDRGNSLIYWIRNIILIASGIKYILSLNLPQTISAGLLITLFILILGYLDLDIFKFSQREAELVTGKYNYYFKKLKLKA